MLRHRPYSSDRHTPDRLLQTFLDEELDPTAAIVVERHLGSCPACRADARVYRTITASIRGLARPLDASSVSRLRLVVDELTG